MRAIKLHVNIPLHINRQTPTKAILPVELVTRNQNLALIMFQKKEKISEKKNQFNDEKQIFFTEHFCTFKTSFRLLILFYKKKKKKEKDKHQIGHFYYLLIISQIIKLNIKATVFFNLLFTVKCQNLSYINGLQQMHFV